MLWGSSFLLRGRPAPESTPPPPPPPPPLGSADEASDDEAAPSEIRQIDASELQPTIVFDDSGDSILVLGTDASGYQPVQVSRTAMILASPVWRKVFERHWNENGTVAIPLPDEELDAMHIVLRIAHLRFHELPKKNGLTIDALLQLSVVCDRYDIVKLVRPFLDLYGWAQCHYPDITSGERCHPAWFFVAWTFGYKDSFQNLAKFIVKRTGLDQRGNAMMDSGQEFPLHMPPALLERILEIRETTLTAMLDVLYDILDDITHVYVCQVDESCEPKCRAMVLGSFISFLLERNLYPIRRAASETSLSIQQLYDYANAAEILTYESHDYTEMVAHVKRTNCSPTSATADTFKHQGGLTLHRKCFGAFHLRAKLRAIYSDIDSAVLQSHIQHMDEQAAK